MSPIPEPIRRAIEAQGKVPVTEIEAALASETVIPPDEVAVAEELGDTPEPDSPTASDHVPEQTSFDLSGVSLRRNRDYDYRMTIEQARGILSRDMEAGIITNCPTCGCLAHVAKRSIHVAQAVGLMRIARAGGDVDYVDTAVITRNDARVDVAKSKWWDLIEDYPARRADGGRAGWWRLTPLGRAFVFKQAKVMKYAHVFDNEVQWRSGPQVSIEDCLRDRFDWAEVMYG